MIDIATIRALMDALPASGNELEMFHCIGEPELFPFDPKFRQGPVEKLTGRAGEGSAGQVLDVAGLLPDNHEIGAGRPLSEHRAGGVAVQWASRAGGSVFAQFIEICRNHPRRLCLRRLPGIGPAGSKTIMEGRRGKLPLPVNHVRSALPGTGDECGNQGGLGKILPVFFRHLRLHRLHLEPCRVEDGGIVGAP
ncbi:hypothetical protein CF98_42075 [Halopseudomonas bauzanensis]|nr:hypothetical protein CF98_42075 [Halopseudomonas bauzanensis]